MRRLLFLIPAFILCVQGLDAQIKHHFRLPDDLREVSGLALIDEDKLIWHNDSNHDPILYITDGEGKLLNALNYPGLPSTDWEDLADSPSGDLFIGNFGNNCHCRTDLAVYVLSETAASPIDSINFHYPDQTDFPPKKKWRNFNMEAMFWYKDSLHLFSKNELDDGNFYSKHYVIPAQPGTYQAILRDSILLKNRVVSGAAISPDQQSFVLLGLKFKKLLGFIPSSKATIFVFPDFDENDFFGTEPIKKGIRPYLYALQYEAIDYIDEETLVVGSEKTSVVPPKAKRIKLGKRFFR